MKVAFVIECMYNSGGMERVLSVLANHLCKDIDVSIVTLYQFDQKYYYPLNKLVRTYDLGVELHKGCLKQCIKNFLIGHHFDVIISLGGMDMYYLHSIKDGSKKIVWFHFAISIAKTAWLGSNPNLLKRVKGQLATWRRIYHARQYDRVVVLSKTDLNAWNKYTKKVILIYNPVTIDAPVSSNHNEKAVLAVGRLDYEKGFDYLIDVWSRVIQKHSDWHLDIYGDGSLRDQLKSEIEKLGISDSIKLCGRTRNIVDVYACHSIFVMSSRTEGLPLVLIEASLCELPLISFDCPSGPREIIENGKNGFLIDKVGDVKAMADKISFLIENRLMRVQMGKNSKQMVERFSGERICKQWKELFGNILYD